MMKIMVIEDDQKLQKYMKEYFHTYDHQVVTVNDFNTVIEQVEAEKPDIILLDINLPKFDGFYYVRMLRKNMKIPIIILSAQSAEAEQIRGMELGADDYVTKPFHLDILLAKMNAVMRRTKFLMQELKTTVGDMTLFHESMKLKVGSTTTELSKNEYRLMKMFMTNAGVVITREELLEELWDETTFVDDNTLTVNITRIKKKIAELGVKNVIHTKRGIGYVFEPDDIGLSCKK